jgi:carboxymethylenebutenolidase
MAHADVAQLVERNLAKVEVAGSIPVVRSKMGQSVEFPSNGGSAAGYLAVPATTPAPGVLVIQEWWGLVPQIKRVCDRLADLGFVALAPDLYHGEIAEHTEMDKAAALMNAMPMDRAARDMGAAVDYLLDHAAVAGDSVGVVGFCMGGMLALVIAALQGDKIAAAVPYYGAPIGEDPPDWSGLTAPVLGHFAEDDGFFPSDATMALGRQLEEMDKDVTFILYPKMGHAFCNEEDPLGSFDEPNARDAWARTVDFLHEHLD